MVVGQVPPPVESCALAVPPAVSLPMRTAGGALGKITRVGDNFVAVEIAPNIEIQVQKPSITTLLPKGTIKTAGQG